MPRVRFGVVLLVPEPVASEVDGVRRAFGSTALGRIPPHVTLVPPVNVRVEDVPAALAVLREAAAASRPFDLVLGPPRTFDTSEGVVYLGVDGPDGEMQVLRRLQASVLAGPLDRPEDHDFVPHVTLTTRVRPERVGLLLDATAGFGDVPVTIDRLHLLQHHEDRPPRWLAVADVPLGPAVVVGRGGIPVELTPSELVDPEALAALAALEAVTGRGDSEPASVPEGARPLVVVARREREVAGVAEGWTAGPVAELTTVRTLGDDGTAEHLRSAWWSSAADRGAS